MTKQQARVLEYLMKYGTIEPLTSWAELGIYRLAAVIHDLKKHGHNIVTNRVKKKNRFGEPVSFAEYELIK